MTLRDASISVVVNFSIELQGWESDMFMESGSGLMDAQDTLLTKIHNSSIDLGNFMDHDGMTLDMSICLNVKHCKTQRS